MIQVNKQLAKRQLKKVKVVRNRPFKYLGLADNKNSAYKTSSAKEYVNLHTRKAQRYPRIGAFEVYYDNFVVFSLLKSSFSVTLNTELSIKTSDSSPTLESTGESQPAQKQPSTNLSISVNTLCELIVQVIQVLSQNNTNVEFLQRVENVFRFLELEWKPISFEHSVIEYMLRKTSKENLKSVEAILKPLIQLTQDKLARTNHFLNHGKTPRKVLPYTYYKKGEKTSRMKSIYQDKTIKNTFISTSTLLSQPKPQPTFTKPQSTVIKHHTIITSSIAKPTPAKKTSPNKPSFLTHTPSSSIKKMNSQTHKGILVPKSLPKITPNQQGLIKLQPKQAQRQTKQQNRRQTQQISSQKSIQNQPQWIVQQEVVYTQQPPISQLLQSKPTKQQGFIIKRHFKRTSVTKFEQSHDQIQPNQQQAKSQKKNCGFIYKNDILKQKLITNQINFQPSKTPQIHDNLSKNSRQINQNVGKIFRFANQFNTQTMSVQTIQQKQHVQEKIFKRTKEVKSVKKRISQRKNSKNIVRNCFSQRRPLSSTLAQKIVAMKTTNMNNLASVSQKQIQGKMFPQNQAPNTQNQRRQVKIKPIQSFQNLRLSEQLLKKSQVKRSQRISTVSKKNECKPIQPQRKYSKDFVQENIRKASVAKRLNSIGNSASFWQNFGPSGKEKQQKKSFSYFKKDKSSPHVRTLSSNDNDISKQLQKGDQCACDNWNQKISSLVENFGKNKSNSSVQKSLQNFCEKGLKVVPQKRDLLQQYKRQVLLEQNVMNVMQQEKMKHIVRDEEKVDEKIEAKYGSDSVKHSQRVNKHSKKNQQVEIEQMPQDKQAQNLMNSSPDRILLPQPNHSPFAFISSLFSPTKSPSPTALITYTLVSQDQAEPCNHAQILNSDHTKTTAYYNHQLCLSWEASVKYEPAYVTYQLNYHDVIRQSEKFATLLRDRNFGELETMAGFSLEGQEIYQQYTVKSLRQLFKLDQLKLFPPQWVKSASFQLQTTKTSHLSHTPSIISDTLQILIRTNPKLISRLFENVKSVNYIGYYGVWLYDLVQNKFNLVVIDDQFCVAVEQNRLSNDGTDSQCEFIFGGMLEQKAIWFMVLEKAMAKMLGGYGKLYQASFSLLFKLLTGCQYVQFKDLSLEKLSKIFTQKIFHNKKSFTYATASQSSIFNHSQELNGHSVQKITGWNFNEKNPFLSLVHFESPNRRIQSVTMMDFSKEFDGITMLFFNPNFVLNHVKLGEENSETKSSSKKLRAIQISSSSYSKDNLCYISLTHGHQLNDSKQFDRTRISKKSLKTTIKLYKQVLSYDTQGQDNKFSFPHRYQQEQEGQTLGYNFRYNGQITKSGQFFFQVGLKGGKNLCFIESDVQCLNIGFYSQEKVDVKCLAQNDANKLKLMNGNSYGNNVEKLSQETKVIDKRQNKKLQKHKQQQTTTIFKQKNINQPITKTNDSTKTKHEPLQKKNELKKSHILVQSRTVNRGFLQDQMLQCSEFNGQEIDKKTKNGKGKRMLR